MKNKYNIILGFVLLIGLVLSACNNTSPATENVMKEDVDNDKDTLIIGLDDDPPQLDPHKSSTAVDRQVFHSIFNKLVDIDENQNIIPELAKEWEVSDDNKTYIFHLQEGVEFHDGTPFNAEAVKFNFERMLDPNLGSPRRGEVELVDQINVIDDLTVEIKLEEPFAPFLGTLTDRAGMMLSPTAVKELGDDFSQHPVGTGPYQFEERELQNHIKVTRFDNYWTDKAKIKHVVYKPYTDENIRITNFISGETDMLSVVGYKDIKKLESDPNVTLLSREGRGFLGLHLNSKKAPFNSKKFRQAINLAVDRKALAEVAYYGGALPAVSAFPPSSWAHNPDLEVPSGDIERAKELIEEAGVKDASFSIKVKPFETDKQLAQMVQSMLKEAGVTVSVEMEEIGALLNSADTGDFDAVYLGWDGRTDPDDSVSRFFMSNGPNNYAEMKNEKIDKFLTAARTNIDEEIRKDNYRAFSEVLFDEAEYIFLVHPNEYKAIKNNVKGFNHIPDGMIRPETIYFE